MWARFAELVIKAIDWLGRAKDSFEGLPWLWRAFWFLLGPGAILMGSYEIELPIAGKVIAFVLLTLFWFTALNQFERWRQRRLAQGAQQISEDEPHQNMPIWELFFLLAPNWRTMDQRGQADVAQRIRDALALDRLKSWGRPIYKKDWIDEAVGPIPSPPPKLIKPEYWQEAEFTYWFMTGERRDEFVHAEPNQKNSELPSYTDVHVQDTQAEKAFGIKKPLYSTAFLHGLRSSLSSIHAAFEGPLPNAAVASELYESTAKIRGDLVGKGGLEADVAPVWDHLRVYCAHKTHAERLSGKLTHWDSKLSLPEEESFREHEHFAHVERDNIHAANAAAIARVERELDYANRQAIRS